MAIRELKVCLLGVSPEPPSAGDPLVPAPPTSLAPLSSVCPHLSPRPLVPWAPLSVRSRPPVRAPPRSRRAPSSRVPLGPPRSVRPLSLWGPPAVLALLGFGSAPELSGRVPPGPAGVPGSALASPRWGQGRGRAPGFLCGDRKSGGRSWPRSRPLRPRRAFSFAFDNFLPAETFK